MCVCVFCFVLGVIWYCVSAYYLVLVCVFVHIHASGVCFHFVLFWKERINQSIVNNYVPFFASLLFLSYMFVRACVCVCVCDFPSVNNASSSLHFSFLFLSPVDNRFELNWIELNWIELNWIESFIVMSHPIYI